MVTIRALKDCPTAAKGTIFEAPEQAASILIAIGAAERYAPEVDLEPEPPAAAPTKTRGRYHRADLRADD